MKLSRFRFSSIAMIAAAVLFAFGLLLHPLLHWSLNGESGQHAAGHTLDFCPICTGVFNGLAEIPEDENQELVALPEAFCPVYHNQGSSFLCFSATARAPPLPRPCSNHAFSV